MSNCGVLILKHQKEKECYKYVKVMANGLVCVKKDHGVKMVKQLVEI